MTVTTLTDARFARGALVGTRMGMAIRLKRTTGLEPPTFGLGKPALDADE